MATAVRCTGVTKGFGEVQAVDNLDLEVVEGQILVLLGPSGCGKTTTLRLIAGFEQPEAGAVSVGGTLVAGPDVWVAPERRKVGMVFQDGALFPHLSVEQNVAYGLRQRDGRRGRVADVLRLVGMDNLSTRMPHELSGGQQQRLALARALAPGPDVLLLDEPFSNLDPRLRDQVRGDVLDILHTSRATAIFVTHDQEEALLLGDLVGVMQYGKLVQLGPPEEVFHRPASRFVAEFIGVADFVTGQVDGLGLVTEIGVLNTEDRLPHGVSAEVMLRPSDVTITQSDNGTGEVVDRVFKGTHYLYSIALPSGAVLHSLRDHSAYYRKGDRVAISLERDRTVTAFLKGQAPMSDGLGYPVLAHTEKSETQTS